MGLFSQKNTGRDVTVTLITTGGVITLSPLTMFRSKRRTVQLESKPLTGKPIFDDLPDGWEGRAEWDRDNVSADAYFAAIDTLYYQGGVNITQVTIDQLVQEVVGSITQFQYVGVALNYEAAGDWEKDKFVKCGIDFRASDRLRVS